MQGGLYSGARTPRPEDVTLRSVVTIGASGAVTNQTKRKVSGFVVTRSAAGIYHVTLLNKWAELTGWALGFMAASDAPAANTGTQLVLRSETVTTTKLVIIHVKEETTPTANADPASGAKLSITLHVTGRAQGTE